MEKSRRYLLEIQCKAPDKKVPRHKTAINYFLVSGIDNKHFETVMFI